jgi:hypothetical protein
MRLRHRARRWRSIVPIALFAALLAVIQLASLGRVTLLPVKTVVVALLLMAVSRLVMRVGALPRISPGTPAWRLLLFALVTRHFVGILRAETARALRAWSLAAPRRLGPLAWRSLAWAMAAIVVRSWVRAERFYAAQRLRGLTA